MNEQYYTSEKIAENTWIIQEPTEEPGGIACCYLLTGKDRGILIDSAFGRRNLKEYVQTLTDKPVNMVACTHGHPDHTGGNCWFDIALMSKKSAESMRVFFMKIGGRPVPDDSAIIYVEDGSRIELGDRQLEVISLEGHDHGGLCFLDHGERLLFTGDSIGIDSKKTRAPGGMLWYKDAREQPSLFLFMKDLAKLLKHRDEYDFVWWGHGCAEEKISADIINHYMVAVLEGLDGKEEKHPLKGDVRFPYRYYDQMRLSTYKDANVVYDIRYAFMTQKGFPTPYM